MRERLEELDVRLLAPAALALFAIALLIVVIASLGGGGGDDSADSRTTGERPARTRTGDNEQRTPAGATAPSGTTSTRRVYVVRPGDSLVQIAQRTQVPIERLIALNPSVDPQALVTGQRIKLRQ
jgi:LysM repeat protein